LDISKRNLDRVLYFAQFIVTSVDEEARQRALKRIDDEEQTRLNLMSDAASDRISALDDRLADEKQKLVDAEDLVVTELEDELNTRTEHILSEARKLQDRLEGMMGFKTSEAIIFSPTETVIVEAEETVNRDYYAVLNTVAQDALDALEKEITERKEELIKPAEVSEAPHTEEIQDELQRVNEELQQKNTIIRNHYDALREELLSLTELQFFNEQRYRELRQRWGQVFKAGMGAEAVYELLTRLELNSLSETLWHEVRYGRSAQRRKKATRRLRVVEALRESRNKPEWMIMTVLPVLPP
jgi:DNA-directed RNA polymerase subunit beta'